MGETPQRAAVFLDRDGTIIEDTHYPRDPEAVRLLPGAAEALREMHAKGFLLYVVSNQSGVGRGIISDGAFLAVHRRVCELLQNQAVPIEAFAYCFHRPDDPCHCRKPLPGLAHLGRGERPIDFGSSAVVGDRDSDLGLARALGARAFLVRTGKGRATEKSLIPANIPYTPHDDLRGVAKSLPNLGYNAASRISRPSA